MSDSTSETAKADGPYRVLARKYRPQTFDDLLGHGPMVRTLTHAFEQDRIAHAFMLTGIRGIGKTTTARILARALNCIGADGTGGPTIQPCGVCEPCVSIAESQNVDVLEMDAASRTGIDDIREIIEGVRYAPASARYKVYIIDEVHMLSKAAFNGLLKTLEEPPAHVKFVLATTEIRKVPVTVLSRCQRFDLARIDAKELAAYLGEIAGQENAKISEEGLLLMARAAEGSVRDGVSLLDRAIAEGTGADEVTADMVRTMLGLADRSRVITLFAKAMGGDAAGALDELAEQVRGGAEPAQILQDLAEFTHFVTRLKVAGSAAAEGSATEAEMTEGRALADSLGVPALTRAWQFLLKGIKEADMAANPLSAAEMVLIRLCHAADLPDPGDLVKRLLAEGQGAGATPSVPSGGGGSGDGGGGGARAMRVVSSQGREQVQVQMSEPAARVSTAPQSFEDAVALLRQHDIQLATQIATYVRPVSYAVG
ncbi:MAG: DNA polymerase III subunit gamma/tau, partial [Alphaproteobacteria bacterium]